MRNSCFKCVVCGQYVPLDKRKILIKYMQYWNGFYEDVEEQTLVYHKKCYKKEAKK